MMAGPSPDADADAAAASDDGRAQGREVSLPVREDVTSDLRDLIARAVPDLPDPDALIDAVSDELILKGDASLVLDSVFFQAIVPAPVREDPGYRRRVAEALAGLREHRRTLFTKRDEATSAGLESLMRSGEVRYLRERPPGSLGAFVGQSGSPRGGWVSLPDQHAAYLIQEEIDGWKLFALETLARLHL